MRAGTLSGWQDNITEYLTRLREFARLVDRGASPELLREVADGVFRARARYLETNVSANPDKVKFEKLVSGPDPKESIPSLHKRFRDVMKGLNQ